MPWLLKGLKLKMKIACNGRGYLQVPMMLKSVLQESVILSKGDCQQWFSKW
jgi:hypothetical protein